MSVVDHFIDGFLGLTDYRRLKIGQMFSNLKIFFGVDHFFFNFLNEFVTVLLMFMFWVLIYLFFWP